MKMGKKPMDKKQMGKKMAEMEYVIPKKKGSKKR